MGNVREKLVGQKIVRLEQGKVMHKKSRHKSDGLILYTDQGEYFGFCDADCCAQTWIEHLEVPKDIVGATILEVVCGEPTSSNSSDWDVLDQWVDKVITDRGHVDIEMRCSHNGWYSGWLSYVDMKKEDAFEVVDE